MLQSLSESYVKLFVGNIPETSTPEELTVLFEQFGELIEVVMIKNPSTGQSKRSCFVKYKLFNDAQTCIDRLHNQKIFSQVELPLQVRLADGEDARLNNKLFVGQIPRNTTENEIQRVFEGFGQVTDVYIIKGPDGIGKGAAFVKFANRNESNLAIASLHLKFIFPGGKSPIRVSYAQAKNHQQKQNSNLYPAHNFAIGHGIPHGINYPINHGMLFNAQHAAHFGIYPSPPFFGNAKLFIGALPPHINETFLQTLFSSYGTVTEVYILRNADGIPKGSAFVKFANVQQAQQAVSVLNGFLIPGFPRPLIVKFANETHHQSNSFGSRYYQKMDHSNHTNDNKLFVGGLPLNIAEQHIMGIFYLFGTITEIFIMRKPDGTGKGAAFVKFATREQAESAIKNLHNTITIPGSSRPLIVKFAHVFQGNGQEP